MSNYGVKVAWSERDGMYLATCLELPDVTALGDTYDEAIAEFQVALDLTIDAYKAGGWDLPQPLGVEDFSGQFRLRVPKSLHSWLSNDRQGVSLNTLVTTILAQARGRIDTSAAVRSEISSVLKQWTPAVEASIQSVIDQWLVDAENSHEGAGFLDHLRNPFLTEHTEMRLVECK
jgi:predicted RNase H-like HicB family nuclease